MIHLQSLKNWQRLETFYTFEFFVFRSERVSRTAHYQLYRGEGIEEKLGGGDLNLLKPERGALKKYREMKEGGL
jgi:hypothetical protein